MPVPVPVPVASPSGSLFIAGDNGSPTSVFPLQHCQGDCDSDSDCAVNLVCFERNSGQAVPGCSGTPEGDKDYCTRKEDLPPELTDTGDNYDPVGAFPLGRCEGDCDGDSGNLCSKLSGPRLICSELIPFTIVFIFYIYSKTALMTWYAISDATTTQFHLALVVALLTMTTAFVHPTKQRDPRLLERSV